MYNYFLKARVSLRAFSSHVINPFTQVAIVLALALVSSHAPEVNSCYSRFRRHRIDLESSNQHAPREKAIGHQSVSQTSNLTAISEASN
jgi:hypothetical protein